jgi:hypothetical protein
MIKVPKPIIHVFKEFNEGKYKGVKHYELQEVSNGNTLLSNQIHLSLNRKFAKSMPEYWLKIRQGKKWSKCITGVFKTNDETIYFGDVDLKKHLLLFKLSLNARTLKVYYFLDYHTGDLSKVLPLLNS